MEEKSGKYSGGGGIAENAQGEGDSKRANTTNR
jgi:hypothetical protein